MTKRLKAIFPLSAFIAVAAIGSASAGSVGKAEYISNCARCHGSDGKGGVPAMRKVPGYRPVDLTILSRENDGKFPRQEVYDAVDGRKRFPAHFVGDMPTWGLKFREPGKSHSPTAQEAIHRKISAVVDYIESIQEK